MFVVSILGTNKKHGVCVFVCVRVCVGPVSVNGEVEGWNEGAKVQSGVFVGFFFFCEEIRRITRTSSLLMVLVTAAIRFHIAVPIPSRKSTKEMVNKITNPLVCVWHFCWSSITIWHEMKRPTSSTGEMETTRKVREFCKIEMHFGGGSLSMSGPQVLDPWQKCRWQFIVFWPTLVLGWLPVAWTC